MTQFMWLGLCFFLAALLFAMLFFRKRIAYWLSAHPRAARMLALILAAIMLVLSLIPIVIIGYHGMG